MFRGAPPVEQKETFVSNYSKTGSAEKEKCFFQSSDDISDCAYAGGLAEAAKTTEACKSTQQVTGTSGTKGNDWPACKRNTDGSSITCVKAPGWKRTTGSDDCAGWAATCTDCMSQCKEYVTREARAGTEARHSSPPPPSTHTTTSIPAFLYTWLEWWREFP